MEIVVLENEAAIARAIAGEIAEVFRAKPAGVLGTATGSSPLAIYAELSQLVRRGEVSFAQATSFQLDEYVGLPLGHPETYQKVILRDFGCLVDIAPANVHAPEGCREDIEAAAGDYERAIAEAGGVDYQILGIGSDGHIAFNEPGGALDSRTHLEDLTEQTRRDNSRFFGGNIDLVPTRSLTQGLGTIMEARQIGMIVLGKGKAEAVRAMVEGPVDPACPASVLQGHPNCRIYLDPEAASLLQR